ncbi:MAG: GIN domain-containing protein [Flavobacterium sp.]
MNRLMVFLGILTGLFWQCSSLEDCLQSSGKTEVKTIQMPAFQHIEVGERVSVIIEKATQYEISITTGSNLMPQVEAKVEEGVLKLSDHNTCNWSRSFGTTQILVKTPTLENVFVHTEQTIRSNGILEFPIIRLIAMTTNGKVSVGEVDVTVQCNQLVIESNSDTYFTIKGNANQGAINFYHGLGYFYGENLSLNQLQVFHRGVHDVKVRVTNQVSGKLLSTGNLVLLQVPQTVDVEQLFTGKVIYP